MITSKIASTGIKNFIITYFFSKCKNTTSLRDG